MLFHSVLPDPLGCRLLATVVLQLLNNFRIGLSGGGRKNYRRNEKNKESIQGIEKITEKEIVGEKISASHKKRREKSEKKVK